MIIERKSNFLTHALFFQLGSDSSTFCTMLEDQTLSTRRKNSIYYKHYGHLCKWSINMQRKGQKGQKGLGQCFNKLSNSSQLGMKDMPIRFRLKKIFIYLERFLIECHKTKTKPITYQY